MRYLGFERNVTGEDGEAYRIINMGSRTLGIFAEHVKQQDELDRDLTVGSRIGAAAVRVGSDTELKAGDRLHWRDVDPADIHSAVRADVSAFGEPGYEPLHIGETDANLEEAMVARLGRLAC